MLEQFFSDPARVERLGGEPLGPHLRSFATRLAGLGYAASTARSQIEFLGELGQWLTKNTITVADVDEHIVDAFLAERRRQGRLRGGQSCTVRTFVEHLRSAGAVGSPERKKPNTPLAALEEHYGRYLKSERGLTRATLISYLPFVHRFLLERFGGGELRFRQLGRSDISSFLLRHAHSMSPGTAKLMVTAFRSFFRFLLQRGEIEIDLAASVPTVANWRLSTVPKYLTPREIQTVLGACNQETPTGRRDYSILLLVARLGLRAGEVVALNLQDVDWRAGEITVPGKGLVHDRMPLPVDVGQALAAYLRRDRPRPCESRRVFIRMKAPRRGFANPSTLSTIVRRALERAGLEPPVKGAHLLRHSLATEMLHQGGSLAEIGEVLRHRAPNTTEIYAKVDFDGLRCLALPWPENGGKQ
jgi:site-specific recombinase XerD